MYHEQWDYLWLSGVWAASVSKRNRWAVCPQYWPSSYECRRVWCCINITQTIIRWKLHVFDDSETVCINCRYLITGLVYAFLVGVTPAGPLLDALKFFEIILTPQVILSSYHHHIVVKTTVIIVDMFEHQAILITSVRAVLALVWELASRVITTTLLFGVFESVRILFNFLYLQLTMIISPPPSSPLWRLWVSRWDFLGIRFCKRQR